MQYFSAIEAQQRLAPHLHAAIRGAIPRAILRQVIQATYYTLWWPQFDQPVHVERVPVWTGADYVDPDTGEVLPTWQQAVDALDTDPDAQPAHVLWFGRQLDLQGVIFEHADRAIRYLTKYLTKAIGETHTDPDTIDAAHEAHIDRMHAELRYLPCSPRCANWLRYGVQPDHPGPGLIPGQCSGRAHDRENLGINRRVLPSRKWSGKTIAQHRADRAEVVRQTLLSAGMDDLDVDRLAASVTLLHQSDPALSRRAAALARAVRSCERHRGHARRACGQCFDNRPTTLTGPPLVAGAAVKGERSESAGPSASEALDNRDGDQTLTAG